MAKVVTLGEIMLRLSTPGYARFVQSNYFDVVFGGGEANVAVSLANYGHDAYFVTKLPEHEIGQSACNALTQYGVHTDYIVRGGDRVGIYFLETGASMRPSKVIYDRKGSSIAEASYQEFDFDVIFDDCDWFHFSGITPALSVKAQELTLMMLKAAKRHHVPVSCDLNYRKKLWSVVEARQVMTGLMAYVDVCIGNEEDADHCLGFKPDNTDVKSGDLSLQGYESICKQMKEKFNFKYIVSSLRESHSATKNGWSGIIYDGLEFYHSRKYDIHIVDRVGGGDSFAAGLIHYLLKGKSYREALDFAVAASALKHTIPGDFNHVSENEVETLMKGDASGRVIR
jgi:2-dehydro-3-deoxygluconokinase